MTDINKVLILGRLTKDLGADERSFGYLQNGTCKAQISIAVNESKKDANGNWQEAANFFDVVIWGKTAENLKPYLKKGTQIAVEGRLKQDRWQDKQTGNNMSKVYINAENIQLIGGKKEEAPFSPNTTYPTAQAAQQASAYAQQYAQQQAQQNFGQQNAMPQFGQPAQQNFVQPVQQQMFNGQPFKEDIPGFDENKIPF